MNLDGIPDVKLDDIPDSQIDLFDIPESQGQVQEAKGVMENAWQTCKDVGNVYPLFEAALSVSSGIVSLPVAGLGGLLGLPFGLEASNKVISTLSEWLTYQPMTEGGARLTQAAMFPFEKLNQAALGVGDFVQEKTGNDYLATAAYTAIAGAPALYALRALPKVVLNSMQKSTAWRSMTVKERGLVVQSLDETIRKNPAMTEGEILRKYEGLREEALARRIKPAVKKEAPEIPEFKKTPEAYAFGEKATPEQYSQLKKLSDESTSISSRLRAEGDINGAIREATRGQLFREAIQKYDEKQLEIKQQKKAEAFNDEVREFLREDSELSDAEIEEIFIGFSPIEKPAYRGSHRPVTEEGGGATLDDLTPAFGEDIYTKNAVQYYGTGDDILDKQTVSKLKTLRGKPDAEIEVYRAIPKDVSEPTLVVGDWVTINKEYAKSHGEDILGGEYKIVSQEVKVKDLVMNADNLHEQGYYPKARPPSVEGVTQPSKGAAAAPWKDYKKYPVKKTIREATGQVKKGKIIEWLPERIALRDQIKLEARAARDAYRAGKNEEAYKHAQKVISLYQRRKNLRDARDYLKLSDSTMKKLLKNKDVGLMSDYEFSQFKQKMLVEAVKLEEQHNAKIALIKLISDKRLKKTDNYRRALELPPIRDMSTEQLNKFFDLLEPFQEGDVFLGERELETVGRTDLGPIKVWREAREKLAKETGATKEEIESIKVTELDDFRYDTRLAERNPFYKMMVSETVRKDLEALKAYYNIEPEALDLARKAEKSIKRGLVARAIPQDKQIIEYLETPDELKPAYAESMTPEQLDYANFIQEYFANALEYLIKTQAITKGRENYFTHMRRSFLENVKEEGLGKALRSVYENYKQDEAVFNILDDDTGNILPLEKFFQFSLHRSGELLPTANVTKAFLAYARMFEKKKALDELIPKMDIYSQAFTPEIYTPRGLEFDRSLKKFVYKYINNKKGRRIRWIAKQNGQIDMSIRAIRTLTTVLDLGLNIPVGVASFVGEQVTSLEGLGVKNYTTGIARLKTKQGKQIVKDNIAFVGKSVFPELMEPGKVITERFMEGLFSLFRLSTVTANKVYLLGSLTKEEFQSGDISSKRLAEIRLDMGRWRKVAGAESLVGSTSAGGAVLQYKTWAVPIISTTIRDIGVLADALKNKKAFPKKEALELWRLLMIGSAVAIVGALVLSDKEDRSFLGQLKAKAYRELNTLMQGLGPALWASIPRALMFLKELGQNLQEIINLEKYKTKPGLKGVEGLKRQFTPRAVEHIAGEEKKSKRQK